MLPKEDILGDSSSLAVNAKVTARYNNKFLDAKILDTGDFDDINAKFLAMQPNSAVGETDSPKGRGHRVMKRKTMSDFVSLDGPSEDEVPVVKKKSLQRHAAAAAGEDVIQELLSQGDKDVDGGSNDSITLNLDAVVLQSEDTAKVKELETQLETALNKIKELEEQNSALQKQLPALLKSLRKCVDRLVGSSSSASAVTPQLQSLTSVTKPTSRPSAATSTPARPTPSPMPMTEPSSPAITPVRSSPSPSPASTPSQLTKKSHETPTSCREPFEDFEVNHALIHRAMQAKDKSKLVCNLLRCLFTRREMATSSLKGKDYAKGKRVLDPKKVEAIINTVQKRYPDCERSFVRTRITQKLKDERRAFFEGRETES